MTLAAGSTVSICPSFKQSFYLYLLAVGNISEEEERKTDFKVNYLVSSTCGSIWILLKAETWCLGGWRWCHGPKICWRTLHSMKSSRRALTEALEVQHQICQASGGAGHGEIPNICQPGRILFESLIGWSESSVQGLVNIFHMVSTQYLERRIQID